MYLVTLGLAYLDFLALVVSQAFLVLADIAVLESLVGLAFLDTQEFLALVVFLVILVLELVVILGFLDTLE